MHRNKKLQTDYNKYGKEGFLTEILEEFSYQNIEDRFKKEQYYMDKYSCYKTGYNCTSNAAFNYASSAVKNDWGFKVSKALKGKKPKNFNDMIKTRWRPIVEIENGVVVKEYANCKQAGEFLGINYKTIHCMLKGKAKVSRKFPNKTWRYKDDLHI